MSHRVKGMEWGIKGEAVYGDKTNRLCFQIGRTMRTIDKGHEEHGWLWARLLLELHSMLREVN
jgi:hypothetical protein